MFYDGEYGSLPAVDAAKYSLARIEDNLTDDEITYIKKEDWIPLPEGYEINRLFLQIMGLQKVIYLNGGEITHSKLPRIWWPKGDKYEKS